MEKDDEPVTIDEEDVAGTPADRVPGTPIDVDGSRAGSPSAQAGGAKKTKGKKPQGTLSESLEADGGLPGAKDGLGAFPPGSDWAELMLALKLKGMRFCVFPPHAALTRVVLQVNGIVRRRSECEWRGAGLPSPQMAVSTTLRVSGTLASTCRHSNDVHQWRTHFPSSQPWSPTRLTVPSLLLCIQTQNRQIPRSQRRSTSSLRKTVPSHPHPQRPPQAFDQSRARSRRSDGIGSSTGTAQRELESRTLRTKTPYQLGRPRESLSRPTLVRTQPSQASLRTRISCKMWVRISAQKQSCWTCFDGTWIKPHPSQPPPLCHLIRRPSKKKTATGEGRLQRRERTLGTSWMAALTGLRTRGGSPSFLPLQSLW